MSINSIKGSVVLSGGELAVALGGDASARVAAMLLEQSQEQRGRLSKARQLEEERPYSLETQEVEAMREEALHVRAAATSRAIGSIVSGSLQMAGGFAVVSADCDAEGQASGKICEGAGNFGQGLAGLEAAASDYLAGQARA